MAKIDDALATLPTMSAVELRTEWRRVYRSPAPNFSPDLMARAIAYELQTRRFGGLSKVARKEICRLGREVERTGTIGTAATPGLAPGTRLSRDWHGRTYIVDVVRGGFVFEGEPFQSLSEIARRITGTRWSGPRFFGLTTRSAQSADCDA